MIILEHDKLYVCLCALVYLFRSIFKVKGTTTICSLNSEGPNGEM